MVNKDNVGHKIFELRKRKGITQEKLASLINVTPQAISKWENCIALPDTYLLPTLANLFHVSLEELLCTESENNKDNQKSDKHQIMYILADINRMKIFQRNVKKHGI